MKPSRPSPPLPPIIPQRWVRARPAHIVPMQPAALVLALFAALAFDPYVLLLSWSVDRQEAVPATSAATCREAIDAIRAGRWLQQDPPIAMVCRQGNAFSPGEMCIENYNCGQR